MALLAAISVPNLACWGRPNIVFILADDLGWSDVSTGLTNLDNGNPFVETPAIDRLATEGVAFTNAYTAGPNCAPTRAALLTGRYGPHPTNNVFNVGSLRRGPDDTLLVGAPQGLPSGKDGIPHEAVTYAEVLRAAGYRTAHFGKFHVVETRSADRDIRCYHGFDENFGGNQSGFPQRYHAKDGKFGKGIGPELDAYADDYTPEYVEAILAPLSRGVSKNSLQKLVGTPKHITDAMTDAAIDFMDRSAGSPFLVQFHPYAVHTPVGPQQARSDLLTKYRGKGAARHRNAASFAALAEGLDQSVSRLVHYLRTTPDPADRGRMLADNTIVIFSSDNGGRLPQSDNGPLRGQKGELYEGGVRVPWIVWSANQQLAATARVCHTPVTSIDIWPTFATLAEADVAPDSSDGADLTALFIDPTTALDRDHIFWHFPGYLVDKQRNQRPQSIVRSGRWKLIYSYETQSYELYDLSVDLGEQNNLASQRPAVTAELSARLLEWLEAADAPLATVRSGSHDIKEGGPRYAGGSIADGSVATTVNAGEEFPFVSSAINVIGRTGHASP